jgi:hypothetical protein
MKRSILIGVLGVGSAVAAYGQGAVNFSNYYGGSTQTTGVIYGNGPAAGEGAGSEISVELYYGASTDTLISELTALASSITVVGTDAPQGPSALGSVTGSGYFAAGSVVVPSIGGTAVPGGTYAFAIKAFGTYDSVSYAGASGIFEGTTAAAENSPVPNLPTGLLEGNILVSSVVPEPTTLALGGLGLAGLLIARRKKA